MSTKKLVKVCRTSGMPVKIEHLDAYQNEFRSCYDRMMARVGLTETKSPTPEQMARLNKVMDRIEKTLMRKYPNTDYWPYITSRTAWKKRIEQHGPIFVAKDSTTNDISYIILDTPLN